MSLGSDSLYTNKAKYRLNQLFGYQDADEHRENENRLRDAFQEQHAWNDNMDNADWQAAFPYWNLGAHRGTIGIDMRGIGPAETFFFGDGEGIANITKGGMNNLCQVCPVVDPSTAAYHFGTFSNGNEHFYWPLSMIANGLWNTTSLGGFYWAPQWLNAPDSHFGAPEATPASNRNSAGTPILHLGGTFKFHHRFQFHYFALDSHDPWTGSPFYLHFRFLGEDGVIYGTNGAGDTNGYADGVITILPVTLDPLNQWQTSVWICETEFQCNALPEQNYRLIYGLNTPTETDRIMSNAVWTALSVIFMNNYGGSYPSITPPGAWELTRARYLAIFSAGVADRRGIYDLNQFVAWTTAD